MTLDEALDVLRALQREGVELVVIGSMAMAAQVATAGAGVRFDPRGRRAPSATRG